MRIPYMILAVLALVLTNAAQGTESPDPRDAVVANAAELIAAHKPAESLQLLDPVLTDLEAQATAARTKGLVFCATSQAETLAYLLTSASNKTSSVVLSANLCTGLFLKAYAFTELGRKDEAIKVLERLTSLAPMHGHYLVELGYDYQVTGQPDKAKDAYQRALDSPGFDGDPATNKRERARAMRGLAYLMVDQGNLDGGEKEYRQSLKYDPDSPVAKSELEYIAKQRSR